MAHSWYHSLHLASKLHSHLHPSSWSIRPDWLWCCPWQMPDYSVWKLGRDRSCWGCHLHSWYWSAFYCNDGFLWNGLQKSLWYWNFGRRELGNAKRSSDPYFELLHFHHPYFNHWVYTWKLPKQGIVQSWCLLLALNDLHCQSLPLWFLLDENQNGYRPHVKRCLRMGLGN